MSQLQLALMERVPEPELIPLALLSEFIQGLRKLVAAPLLLKLPAPRVVTWVLHPWAGVEGLWGWVHIYILLDSLFPQ